MVSNELKILDKTRLQFVGKGIFVGILAGFVVSLFRLCIEYLSLLIQKMYLLSHTNHWLLLVWMILSVVSAFFVGLLIRSEPFIKGSGIPQVEGQLHGDFDYTWYKVLYKKFLGGILSVGSGLFLGREGPSIQLGATVGQGVADLKNVSKFERNILITSGASAGLSAAFNAPIAGLMFIIEEIHHTFSPLIWLTSFASALAANFISSFIFGLKPVLYLGELQDVPLHLYWLFLILGLVLGILAKFYQVVLLSLPKWYSLVPFPSWLHGIVPFLLVLPIGYYFPHSLGGGNAIITSIESQHYSIYMVFGLFILRFLFSMISYGASLPGGIFLPILTLGAIIGYFFSLIVTTVLGTDPIYTKVFIIVSMAGYFAAIGKAPLTAILLITEMVGSLHHLMETGIVSLVAYLVVDSLGGAPIYESLLEKMTNKNPSPVLKKVLVELPITVESTIDGFAVRDVSWPENTILVSLERGETSLITKGDTIMRAGDRLVMLTTITDVHLLKKQFYSPSSPKLGKIIHKQSY